MISIGQNLKEMVLNKNNKIVPMEQGVRYIIKDYVLTNRNKDNENEYKNRFYEESRQYLINKIGISFMSSILEPQYPEDSHCDSYVVKEDFDKPTLHLPKLRGVNIEFYCKKYLNLKNIDAPDLNNSTLFIIGQAPNLEEIYLGNNNDITFTYIGQNIIPKIVGGKNNQLDLELQSNSMLSITKETFNLKSLSLTMVENDIGLVRTVEGLDELNIYGDYRNTNETWIINNINVNRLKLSDISKNSNLEKIECNIINLWLENLIQHKYIENTSIARDVVSIPIRELKVKTKIIIGENDICRNHNDQEKREELSIYFDTINLTSPKLEIELGYNLEKTYKKIKIYCSNIIKNAPTIDIIKKKLVELYCLKDKNKNQYTKLK